MEAMPYVKGLNILNDCEENQKLVQKLPDWAVSQWNRKATQVMRDDQEFPNFHEFVFFVVTEAEIACNPITSFHALHSSEANPSRHLKEKKCRSSVYHTQAVTETETQGQLRTGSKQPCMFCQDSRHRLHHCPEFKGKALEERRKYVKEKKLCYGCLRTGHNAKDCRNRHTCDNCERRHPTLLHGDNYAKAKPTSVSNPGTTEETATTLSLSVTTKEPSTNTSMIVPVWVSSVSNPGMEILVYALLDTQSDTVFIDQDVSNSLQAKTHPVRLKLLTMTGKDTLVHSQSVKSESERLQLCHPHCSPSCLHQGLYTSESNTHSYL